MTWRERSYLLSYCLSVYTKKHPHIRNRHTGGVRFHGRSVRAVSAAAAVGTAGVFLTVVVVAVEIFSHLECSCCKCLCHLFDVAFGSSDNLYSGVAEGVYRTCSYSAADEDIDALQGEKSGESTVSGVSGGYAFFIDKFAILKSKHCKPPRCGSSHSGAVQVSRRWLHLNP